MYDQNLQFILVEEKSRFEIDKNPWDILFKNASSKPDGFAMLGMLRMTVFFFLRENQKCARNVFSAFFGVFSSTKNRFHAHFFHFLRGHFFAFTGTFFKFSELSRELFWFHALFCDSFFSRALFSIFFTQVTFFSREKNTGVWWLWLVSLACWICLVRWVYLVYWVFLVCWVCWVFCVLLIYKFPHWGVGGLLWILESAQTIPFRC